MHMTVVRDQEVSQSRFRSAHIKGRTAFATGLALLSLIGISAPAEGVQYKGHYPTFNGNLELVAEVSMVAPKYGAANIDHDGKGILIAAEGMGSLYTLTLDLSDGIKPLTLLPAKECTPNSPQGNGCYFDMPVVDAQNQKTGITARVMVSSQNDLVNGSLFSQIGDPAYPNNLTALTTEIQIKSMDVWTDANFFIRFDYQGEIIDLRDKTANSGGAPSPPSPELGPEVYKVLTYNVAGLPQTAFSDDDFGPDDNYTERADEIATKILQNDYDIIAFNEVFDDTLRDELLLRLAPYYPYVLEEAWQGAADTSHRQDSGLMIFSRFPGDPIDIGMKCNEHSEISVRKLDGGDGGNKCDISFWPFSDLDGEDTWAEKGFYWAHFWNPRTNRSISIIGSHTQASYYPVDTELFNDEREARATNFKEIYNVIEGIKKVTDGEDLIFMGDLNVVGDYTGKNSEYMEYFGPSGAFRKLNLGDMWRDTTSPEDPGYSWDGSAGPTGNMVANNEPSAQERLDYMITLDASNYDDKHPAPCFQHMQLRRDFDGAYGDLSDHYGVEAVIGWDSDRCSPIKADKNILGGVKGSIGYRGAYQWYRFDKPGTYSLQVYSADLAVDATVYDVTDLSTPLNYFEGTGAFPQGDRRRISVIDAQGPFYLRIKAHDPLKTGAFKLTLNANQGSSWNDYLALKPDELKAGSFSQTLTGPYQDHLYFKFAQQPLWSTNSGNQTHQFVAKTCPDASSCVPATFTLWNSAHVALYTSAPHVQNLQESSASWLPNTAESYFLTIDRKNENTQRAVELTRSTDLKVVFLNDLTCYSQEDWYGDDEIYANLSVDGQPVGPLLNDLYYGQLDTNGSNEFPLHPATIDLHAIAFKNRITMTLYEVDGGVNDPDDNLGTDSIYNGGLGEKVFTMSSMPDPDIPVNQKALKFHEDDAAYGLNWWEVKK